MPRTSLGGLVLALCLVLPNRARATDFEVVTADDADQTTVSILRFKRAGVSIEDVFIGGAVGAGSRYFCVDTGTIRYGIPGNANTLLFAVERGGRVVGLLVANPAAYDQHQPTKYEVRRYAVDAVPGAPPPGRLTSGKFKDAASSPRWDRTTEAGLLRELPALFGVPSAEVRLISGLRNF